MSDEVQNEYLKQLTGSAGANMIFVVGFILYRALQNRCKNSKSKCATHCGFCDLEIENDDSSSDIENGRHKHENVRKRVQKVQQAHDRELSKGDQTFIPFDVRKIREPENWGVAHKAHTEEGIRETSAVEKAIPERVRSQSQ